MSAPRVAARDHELADDVAPGDDRHDSGHPQDRRRLLPRRPGEVAVGPQGQRDDASNAEIAASLFMSEATVKAHVSRLLSKLDINNRVQIAILVHDAANV